MFEFSSDYNQESIKKFVINNKELLQNNEVDSVLKKARSLMYARRNDIEQYLELLRLFYDSNAIDETKYYKLAVSVISDAIMFGNVADQRLGFLVRYLRMHLPKVGLSPDTLLNKVKNVSGDIENIIQKYM